MLAAPADAYSDLWHALGEPTRRVLLDRLAPGPLSTTALASGLPITRFAVMKHLAVLERAGLVTSRKHGRVRLHHLNRAPLAELHSNWISPRAAAWSAAGTSLARHAEGVSTMRESTPPTSAIVELALDWAVRAPTDTVWTSLTTQIDDWWPIGHRAGIDGGRMRFDARAGGALVESNDRGTAIEWYRVYAVDPGRSIDLVGQLASRYGGPATSLVHIALESTDGGRATALRMTDSVVGRAGPQLRSSITDGWQAILGAGLVTHCSRTA